MEPAKLGLIHFLCSVTLSETVIRFWVKDADLTLRNLLLLLDGFTVAITASLLASGRIGLALALLLVLVFTLLLVLVAVASAAGGIALLLENNVTRSFEHRFGAIV